jgi:hypothetical protein
VFESTSHGGKLTRPKHEQLVLTYLPDRGEVGEREEIFLGVLGNGRRIRGADAGRVQTGKDPGDRVLCEMQCSGQRND